VAELQRWVQSGEYSAIVSGTYTRRGQEAARPYAEDVKAAGSYYGEQVKAAAGAMGDAINKAADAFRDAFKAASGSR
jgi:hypothetical protein